MNEWKKEEINFLKDNYERLSWKQMSEYLGRSISAISAKSSKLGLKKKEKYFYNEKFFDVIDSEEKAYWLGFMIADGCVVYNTEIRNYEISIELNDIDKNHLKKFNKSISGNLEVKFRSRKPHYIKDNYVGSTHSCFIRLYNKHMAESLIKNGCVQKKSKIVKLPFIEENMMRHLIRGIFDGDGCIRNDKKYLRCDITTASLSMIDGLRVYLKSNGIYSHVYECRDGSGVYKVDISGKENVLNFLNLMYLDSNISLDRKFNLYKQKIASLHSDV